MISSMGVATHGDVIWATASTLGLGQHHERGACNGRYRVNRAVEVRLSAPVMAWYP